MTTPEDRFAPPPSARRPVVGEETIGEESIAAEPTVRRVDGHDDAAEPHPTAVDTPPVHTPADAPAGVGTAGTAGAAGVTDAVGPSQASGPMGPSGPTGPVVMPPPSAQRESSGRTAALAVLATLVAVGVVAAAFFAGRSGEASPSTTTAPPETTTSTSTTTTSAAPTTTAVPATTAAPASAPAPAPIGDVRAAPTNLLCKDLAAQGYSYAAAVDYWRVNGQPNRMDADRNGIPCETVYPRADVVAYWPSATYESTVSYGLPGGLLCRDLSARGVGVYDALRYYLWEGRPARMDADGNGIPCETVYSDAAAVWLSEF